MPFKVIDCIDTNEFSFYSDTKGYCDFCKDVIDSTFKCPYEDHCFYKCYSAYNKILQKINNH